MVEKKTGKMDIETARKLVAAELGPNIIKAWLDAHDEEWSAALIQDLTLLTILANDRNAPIETMGVGYTVGYWRGHNDSWK